MFQNCLIAFLLLLQLPLAAQKVTAYKIFNSKGKEVSFEKMAAALSKERVILFGEYHDDPIAHWLQLELAKHLHKTGLKLTLGAEMFERDVQHFLDAYLKGEMEEKAFTDTTHSLWPNYSTDYRPLVEFSKENKIPFVGTNVPRSLARMVYKNGFESLDTLSKELKSYLPPLPIPYDKDLPGYKAMLEMAMGHGGDNLPKAQAIKDATMAWFIVQSIASGNTMLHFNGTYHSDNYEGIGWYLKQYAPELSVGTIAMVQQSDLSRLEVENNALGDFILVVDKDMTRTH
jgi:uncharacterized iron-regulated protein